jgi:hypothetical protein
VHTSLRFVILSWAALLALPLLTLAQSHAAERFAQNTPPSAPLQIPQTPPPNINPNTDNRRATTPNPTTRDNAIRQEGQRQQNTSRIPTLDRGGNGGLNLRLTAPLDPLRRALDLFNLGRPAPPEPPVLSTPENPELRDRIEQLGTSVPDSPQNPTEAPIIGTVPVIPSAARAIRPPTALPARRPASGVPPANERRLVADEVIVEVSLATPAQAIAALEQRNRLTRLDQLASQLSGTNLLRERIQDGRNVVAVVRALENDVGVMSAQPNYLFALQQENEAARDAFDPALQYALTKLRLPEAHQLAMGDNVPVAVIDSGIDVTHPELAGTIAGSFDTLDGSQTPHGHGTAVAGLVAAHARLMGAAPAARILAVRVFDGTGSSAQGSTFNVLKGLDWAAVSGARVINMSFAGPSDPAVHRALEGAFRNGIVLVAAADPNRHHSTRPPILRSSR